MNDVSVPSQLEGRAQGNEKPSPAVMHEYLVEAFETRLADTERNNIVPIGEEVSCPKREWGTSWWEQYSILFLRGIKERRYEYFSWLRITQVLASAMIVGYLWWRLDNKTPKGLKDEQIPAYRSWIHYISFNYQTYRLLLKVQNMPNVNGSRIDSSLEEVGALVAMVFGYHILAYLALRRMKLH